MCGIAGFIAAKSLEELGGAVQRMTDAMARRGPDSQGRQGWPAESGPQAVLGHRRLAILDLSPAGAQPYLSDDGKIGLVFNGCIYNFEQLRDELAATGIVFRSRCDTEVLLRGYEQWGMERLLPRLRGMFAFGIWDTREKGNPVLWLVRDRLGVKPLVYVEVPGGLAFASTAEALRQGSKTGAFEVGPVHAEAVLDVCEYGFVTERHSIHGRVKKLAPATVLEWRAGRSQTRAWWTCPDPDPDSKIEFEEAVEETERLLLESVRLRLIADVPVSALLSGGIDSSLVAWALGKLNANLTAYTLGIAGHESDESPAAAALAAQIGIPHQSIPLPAQDITLLDELNDAYSEPFAVYSALGLLRVSRAIRQSATVVLTGDGGDDIFLGYPFHRDAWRVENLARRIPAPLAGTVAGLAHLLPGSGNLRRLRSFLLYATEGLGAATRAHDGLPFFEQRSLLGPQLAALRLPQRQIAASFDSARHFATEMRNHHLRTGFTSEFMPKVDSGTMYDSLEARAPLLDHVLWEFAARLPVPVHLHGGALKAILRRIAQKRLGNAVSVRPKQGFTVPLESLLAGAWTRALDPLLDSPVLERDGWMRRGSLAPLVADARQRQRAPIQLFYLTVLENWLRRMAA